MRGFATPCTLAVMRAELRRTPIGVDEVVGAVGHAGAGAIDVFVGVVRDTSEGRAVTRLDYEAYATMAELEMVRIGEQLEREISGTRLAVLHRVGTLAVGDTAVVCAASAPHRAEAFLACRMLIDRIKAKVPIWKREHGPDGSAWVGWVDARCGDGHDHAGHERSHGKHPPA